MKPNTRIDNFLAKIAGDPDANEAMVPRSPEEYYLDQIAQNGGGGGGGSSNMVILHADLDTGELDKTWQEIYDAIADGKMVVLNNEIDEPDEAYKAVHFDICTEVYTDYDGGYFCTFSSFFEGTLEPYKCSTDGANGHPALG